MQTTVQEVVVNGTKNIRRSFQTDSFSCGVHAARMVLWHFGRPADFKRLSAVLGCSKEHGTDDTRLKQHLEQRGFQARRRHGLSLRGLEKLLAKGAMVIAHVDEGHYVVVHGCDSKNVYVSDPSFFRTPRQRQARRVFSSRWDGWAMAVSQ